MFKYLVSLFALVIGLTVSPAFAEFQVTESGCQEIGMVVVKMAVNHYEGKDYLDGVLTEEQFKTLNPEIQVHLNLLKLIVQKYPEIDPRSHFEGYVNFCYSASGDVAGMNEYLIQVLKIQSV